ncbi:zinc-binding alcohol dehydrogenase family protein [Roseomonas sp. OT10]|uniref:zinc-binding alcohol dehydrogenase family protein n=1 Tax=Roseomonas cutis TaxID=2897332 RepID=UPI001E5BE67C|nr:zinc-binding alcohol dehydrogenase family protein [Roseomonas sp. OT10]UFN49487.1 zinc-binding alcohol dehydrogenase family protein [Roseomonas sp. OT10]
MKAIAYTHCHPIDHPEALQDITLPEPPAPRGHDLLIEVRAVAVNPVDTKIRRNADPAGEPRVLGFDAAGVVRAVGPEVRLFHKGQEVFYAGSIDRAGSNAELQLVDERIVGPKPRSLSFAEAAALPLTAITAWEVLFDRMGIARGKAPSLGAVDSGALLIVGGAGGVGSIAIQLARRLTGLTVVATASRPETQAWCRELGAHHVLDHSSDLVAQAKALRVAFPYILSTTETPRHWNALAEILAPQGTIGLIDELGGADVQKLKPKAGRLAWEYMFARPVFQTPDMIAQHRLLDEVSHLVDAGALRTTLGERFGRIDAGNLIRAHAAVESGRMRGKAVLEGF